MLCPENDSKHLGEELTRSKPTPFYFSLPCVSSHGFSNLGLLWHSSAGPWQLFQAPNTAGQMCTSPHSMTEELKMYLPSVGSFLAGLFSSPAATNRVFAFPSDFRELDSLKLQDFLSPPCPPHCHHCLPPPSLTKTVELWNNSRFYNHFS